MHPAALSGSPDRVDLGKHHNPNPNGMFNAIGIFPTDPPTNTLTLRGSLDPITGIFYRAPERARVRTPLACDKCRVRKAKVCFVSWSFPHVQSVTRTLPPPSFFFTDSVAAIDPHASDVVRGG